ncbi:phospholipase D/nuclease [Piedraia hortae CBS 480.64]|uniref:Phospholipase D/nuclease n=1 Tax=Piedraia hortae CBS 480.64 TaxID=1314780 RepID=A0A6A7C7K6_9PEZI|nr:phospholipase D/nuclease [Piedraia hortae CBS 480.64]
MSSDDEDVKTAIALSLAESQNSAGESSKPKSVGSMLGLDRKAMEEERLARLASRKRTISPPPLRGPSKLARVEPSGSRGLATAPTRTSEISHSRSEKSNSGLAYPDGVVKKTWAYGHSRNGQDVKIEEVLEPSTLRTAVLSSFQWDVEWVLSKLRTPPSGGSTKCVFVMHAKEDALRAQMLRETEHQRSFLRLCFPHMRGQVHCMHSKLMLLFHPNKLRIAVPTANLLDFDWGETGVMENSVFIIDLPRRGENESKLAPTEFQKELFYFLQKQEVPEDVRQGVSNFNFSATKNMAFVHTVGGSNYRDSGARTGYPGLCRAVRHLGLKTSDLQIDFAASSIGSLKDPYLRALHAGARGEDVFVTPATDDSIPIRERVRIYFPTHETVKASTAGGAGSLCISRKWWEDISFPRAAFRDYVSTRTGLLSHNKILYARGTRPGKDTDATEHVAWAYVGSGNMSESAWGKVVFDKKDKCWKVNCRNWECGVLLPVPANRLKGGAPDLKVFDHLVPPPFVYPGPEYGSRHPWYFMEMR